MAIEERFYKNPINQKTGLPITGVQSDFVFSKRNEFSRREVGLNHPDNPYVDPSNFMNKIILLSDSQIVET